MSIAGRVSLAGILGGIGLTAAVAACASTPEPGDSGHCKTVISGAAPSPVTGYVTLSGDFYPDETIEMTWQDNQGHQTSLTGAPATARTVLDIGPWASGTHLFTFTVSCTIDGETVFDTHQSEFTVAIP